MSLSHLDVLSEELPELFQPRDLAPSWGEDLIFVSIEDPEAIGDVDPSTSSRNPNFIDDLDLDGALIEEFGVGQIQEGAELPDLSPIIVQVLGGAHSGAPLPYEDRSKMPPPDCLAFYLPFHYYHPTWWGVYLLFEGVVWLAGEIVRRSGGAIGSRQAMQAARLFLYYHEVFHHKTECFATRLELTHRQPFYKTGFERLYQKYLMTDDCVEEGLANASALMSTGKQLREPVIDSALEAYVLDSPPGYNRGVEIGGCFHPFRWQFAEDNQKTCLPRLPRKNPEIWGSAQHMFNGIANIKSRVNYVIPRSSPLAARLPLRPLLTPRKLIKKLQELAGLEFVRSGGNHDIYRTASGHTIPIPRHPRDLGRGLLRKILREAGLAISLQEFLQR